MPRFVTRRDPQSGRIPYDLNRGRMSVSLLPPGEGN